MYAGTVISSLSKPLSKKPPTDPPTDPPKEPPTDPPKEEKDPEEIILLIPDQVNVAPMYDYADFSLFGIFDPNTYS